MNNKVVISLIALLLLALIGLLAYNDNMIEDNLTYPDVNQLNRTMIEVSSTSAYKLDEIINEIKTEDRYKGYDSNTLVWMESLKEDNVFLSNNTYVIMNDVDAAKVHHDRTIDITDVYIVEMLDCYVVENRSLGGKNPHDIVLVSNVTDLGNKTYYYEV